MTISGEETTTAMPSPKKSNVIRFLEARRIPYQALTYSVAMRSAAEVARVLGVPAHEVYKTLVVSPPRGRPLLVAIPGPCVLDLKRLAQAIGPKKLRMATQQEAEQLTGLQVGGISALALLERGFQVYLDQSAQALTALLISAGQRGMTLRQCVDDFLSLSKARFVDAAVDRGGSEAGLWRD
jgi:Cys-tRNA(Pro)/Cys-tRNA(Cys) deacylase